jgi:hypothetical protein
MENAQPVVGVQPIKKAGKTYQVRQSQSNGTQKWSYWSVSELRNVDTGFRSKEIQLFPPNARLLAIYY